MKERSRFQRRKGLFISSVGWLFADLLLALAMIFLLANTVSIPRTTPTPTPGSLSMLTPTPTLPPDSLQLDPARVRLVLSIDDPDALLAGNQGTKGKLADEIKSQITALGLQGRRGGLALAYGGAGGSMDGITKAQDLAGKVYEVLDSLGQQRFVFCKTVHYDNLFALDRGPDIALLDIYLFVSSIAGC